MTKPTTTATTKTTAIRMPGKERPAASRSGIQGPPPTKPHHRNLGRNKKPSNSLNIGHAAGLEYRFLRSQPVSLGSDHFTGRDPGGASINSSCDLSR
jgi:hypothetical protein